MIKDGLCIGALRDFIMGVHQPQDTYMVALYAPRATIGPRTTTYTTEGEVSGRGYRAGGVPLSGYQCEETPAGVMFGWTDTPEWPNSTITAGGALIYNRTRGGRAIAVLSFGAVISSTNGMFDMQMPPMTPDQALIWISTERM